MSEELAARVGRDMTDLLHEMDALERMALRYRAALISIRDLDAFMGGPFAPRETPVTAAMRRIADDALS